MIIVIQCAARKQPDVGHMTSGNGKPVIFVANPESAPADSGYKYARPDDLADSGKSWRDVLLEYNKRPEDNPLGLHPAYRLYRNKTYGRLVDRFGLQKVYILSAGWGLIKADFLTPNYDITYSQRAEGYKFRDKSDLYRDFCMLPNQVDEEIVFFGGKDYLPLFCSLTAEIASEKRVFYNSACEPQAPGCDLVRFETRARTNWHYSCANAFLESV